MAVGGRDKPMGADRDRPQVAAAAWQMTMPAVSENENPRRCRREIAVKSLIEGLWRPPPAFGTNRVIWKALKSNASIQLMLNDLGSQGSVITKMTRGRPARAAALRARHAVTGASARSLSCASHQIMTAIAVLWNPRSIAKAFEHLPKTIARSKRWNIDAIWAATEH